MDALTVLPLSAYKADEKDIRRGRGLSAMVVSI
jgi:hypothetical protein